VRLPFAGVVQRKEENQMRRLIVVVALALVVPAAASARPPGPAAPVPTPLPEAQAEALVAAPAAVPDGSVTWSVSPQEALGAASLPGAAVYVAPGLSLAQAVGVAPAAELGLAHTTAAESVGCSSNRAYRTWGTWPYEQQLSDTTYWCAVYGDHITYFSSTANATGTLCDSSWRSSQVTSGGIGYSWFVIRSSAGWSCPTVVPWFNLHPSHYMDYARNAWGSTEYVGSG
jgi:hypothetical protein